MASRKASRKLFAEKSVLEELDKDIKNESSNDDEPVSVEADEDKEGDPDFEPLSSSDDELSSNEPSPKKSCIFPSPIIKPHTPRTPASSARSLGPRSTPSGRSRSPRGRKRSAGRMSVDSDLAIWNDISMEDEAPDIPSFVPKRNPGAQIVMDRMYSPLQLFQLFFSTSVVKTIVKNTNSYAKMRTEAGKKFSWVPLTAKELYSYFAIVIYMGLLSTKTISDYWSGKKIYSIPFPKSLMSRSRFQAISWNLHLCNLEEDRANAQKKGTPDHDRLFKIKPLYTDIITACKTYFHPNRELAIDERMVASKARISFKQYMKDKPTKWGYKLFVLADSVCGYTWNFFVYEGKSSLTTGKGLSYDSVMRLLDLSLLGKGYHVYMDNFYTSPGLLLDLLDKKTLACGTIRSHVQGFPRTRGNELSERAQRGTMRWLREGKLLFVRWMDIRAVSMCSTIHKAYDGTTVSRRIRNPKSGWETREIPIPLAAKDYNKYMGGVDLSDALIGYYNVLHKTRKWYKTFFFHFIDIAVVNSFILHQHLLKSQNKTPLNQKQFREELVGELAGIDIQEDEEPSAQETSKSAVEEQQCWPEYFGSDATCGRRVCIMCKISGHKVKTPVYCSKCNVALCFVSSRNCFKKWHTEKPPEDD
ncbi:piggyBac transposable element-derived protein 4-like [Carassius auratus]|uniref:PiggyBac transposable element-derived protein 4-like n=1 Tax=Carassius auratus TaxID=7957 RepID=A0A6P6LNW0_CARAU|nr:piggyBac transposable element-derived protein 4-like [Carassius auratus]